MAVKSHCSQCKRPLLVELPVGHALYFEVAVCLDDLTLRSERSFGWYSQGLLEGARQLTGKTKPTSTPLEIRRVVYRETRRIVLLNCIDHYYGHVLLKLFNASAHLADNADLGLVILIPKSYEWLVPDGVAEVWTVDVGLRAAKGWYPEVDAFVHEQLKRFDSVFVSRAFSHPDPRRINISDFSRVAPFQLTEFYSKPARVCLIVRDDRVWYGGRFQHVASKVLGRLHASRTARKAAVYQQARLFTAFVKELQTLIPDVRCTVVGVGEPGDIEGVEDLRTRKIDATTEREWCQVYASSHVVVGVHGSNMLLPTAHAAGFVELLPYDRLNNFLQDIFVRHEGRQGFFLGRFVSEHAGPWELAMQVAGIYLCFASSQRLTSPTMLSHTASSHDNRWREAGKQSQRIYGWGDADSVPALLRALKFPFAKPRLRRRS